MIEEEEIGFKEDFVLEDIDNKSRSENNDSEYSDGELKGNEK